MTRRHFRGSIKRQFGHLTPFNQHSQTPTPGPTSYIRSPPAELPLTRFESEGKAMLLEKPKKSDFWIFIGKVLFLKALIVLSCYFMSQMGGADKVISGCRSISDAITSQ
ncbi:MAG: hypothetical protein K2X93_07985 [Candidatus Obscuribacterales bacterium]|nr:hypothetical protein [Candidatus Obscuribacterales bacterium]